MIAHRAFIDLEHALADRAQQQWKLLWLPFQADLKRAIIAHDWHRADRLIDSLDTDKIAINCATYAQTIGLSALLLGASRLSPIKQSQVALNPPLPQLTHGIAQWGFMVARNLPKLLKLRLHKALAQYEHDVEQARHTITKEDRDAQGRFVSRTSTDPWTAHASDAEIKASVAKFQTAYGSDWQAVWSDLRARVIRMASDLKSTFAWGAEFPDHMTDEGKLQRLVFEQVMPHIEKAGFPDPHSQEFSDALLAFQTDAMQYKRVRKEAEMEMELPVEDEDEAIEEASPPEIQDLIDAVYAQGMGVLSLAANLMVSRQSSFGFLVQAQAEDIDRYEISAVLDEHTCPVCEVLDGQIFDVVDGVAQATSIMDAEDPDSLATLAPWPSQSKDSVNNLADSDAQDLVDQGLALPPYHPGCRCICLPVDNEQAAEGVGLGAAATAEQAEAAADSDEISVPSVSATALNALLMIIGSVAGLSALDEAKALNEGRLHPDSEGNLTDEEQASFADDIDPGDPDEELDADADQLDLDQFDQDEQRLDDRDEDLADDPAASVDESEFERQRKKSIDKT